MQTTSNGIKTASRALFGFAVVCGGGALCAWLWGISSDAGHAAASGRPLRPDEALTAIVASAALVGVAWLALGVLLGVISLAPGALGLAARRAAELVTPRLVRRAAGALLGVGLAAGILPGASVAAPATRVHAGAPLPDPGFAPLPDPGWAPPPAAPGSAATPPAAPGSASPPADRGSASPPADRGSAPPPADPPGPHRGWVPSLPVVRAHPDVRVLSPAPRARAVADAPAEVVVRRGDSLWSIAARHLGHDASDAEIARAWPAWFSANRAVLGDDPDLLHPGQVLRAPDPTRP